MASWAAPDRRSCNRSPTVDPYPNQGRPGPWRTRPLHPGFAHRFRRGTRSVVCPLSAQPGWPTAHGRPKHSWPYSGHAAAQGPGRFHASGAGGGIAAPGLHAVWPCSGIKSATACAGVQLTGCRLPEHLAPRPTVFTASAGADPCAKAYTGSQCTADNDPSLPLLAPAKRTPRKNQVSICSVSFATVKLRITKYILQLRGSQ